MTARIDNPPACMGCRHSTPTHPVCPCNCHTARFLHQVSGPLPSRLGPHERRTVTGLSAGEPRKGSRGSDLTGRRKASQPARAVGTFNGWYGAAAVMSIATGWAAANGANTPAETLLCALAAVGLLYLGATRSSRSRWWFIHRPRRHRSAGTTVRHVRGPPPRHP